MRELAALTSLQAWSDAHRSQLAAAPRQNSSKNATKQLARRCCSQPARVRVYNSVTHQLLSAAKRRAQAQLLQVN